MSRALRRHQAETHMRRRLKEDRAQHYNDLNCACYTDPKAMARFKEQPQVCSCWGCGNQRRYEGPTLQELRAAGGTADAPVSKAGAFGRGGANPSPRTIASLV